MLAKLLSDGDGSGGRFRGVMENAHHEEARSDGLELSHRLGWAGAFHILDETCMARYVIPIA